MGDIKCECSECGKHLAIDEKGAGLRERCPDCNSELTVPTPLQDAPHPPHARSPREALRPIPLFDLSDAFTAQPGGFGTLEEIAELMTWAPFELHEKLCGLIDVNGHFVDLLLSFLDNAISKGFTRQEQVTIETLLGAC